MVSMNESSTVNESINPWDKRDLLPSASPKYTVLASLIALLSSVGLGLCGRVAWIAPLITAILFAYVVFAARSPATVTVVLLTAMLGLTFGFEGASVVLSLIVGGMTLAYLMTVLKRSYPALLLPLAGFAISFAVSQDWQTSLLALSFLPAALLLSVATVGGKGRTTAICYTEVGYLISLLVLLLFLVQRATGGIGREQILGFFEGIRASVTSEVLATRDGLLSMIAEVPTESAKQLAEQMAAFYSEDVVSLLFNMLPGVAVILCSILAFDAQMLLGVHYVNSGWKDVVTKEYRFFTMSVTAAVLYTLTFVLSLFISPLTMAGAVIQNVSMILLPGFLVLGARSIAVSFARARGGMRIFLILLFGALFCCSGGGFSLIAIWGAYDRVMVALHKKLSEKIREMGGGDHSDDHDAEE